MIVARVRLLWRVFQEDILAIPMRTTIFFAICLLLLIPAFTISPNILSLFIYTSIFAILAASWNFLAGYVGIVSLAHGSLFGIAAYTAGLLNIHFGLQPWITIPAGALASVLGGLTIAVPALRVRGMYFTLCSIAMPLILTGIVFAFPDFTGGELGVWGISGLADSKPVVYYVTLGIMLLSCFIMWKLTDARSTVVRLGIILEAIREDEIAARAVGVNTVKYKLLAFSISGFFAGVAGGLYAHIIHVAGPSTLELLFAFNPLIWTIFGGTGTSIGPIVGAYILNPLMELLRVVPEVRTLVLGCLIIAILSFMPRGLVAWFRDTFEVVCPRCKVINRTWNKTCRVCGAHIHLQRQL